MFERIVSQIRELYEIEVEERALQTLIEKIHEDINKNILETFRDGIVKKTEKPRFSEAILKKMNEKYKKRMILYRFGPPPKQLRDLIRKTFEHRGIEITYKTTWRIAWLYYSMVINSLFASAVLVKMEKKKRVSLEDVEKTCAGFFKKPPWFIC